ncbi:MAG: bifunctional YncE family protein/alkaline phosphatase family protein [Bacteroidia bacterium]
MKTYLFTLFISLYLCTVCLTAQVHNLPGPAQVRLPNGWALTPAGTHMPLGDLPLNMAFSPSSKLLAVTNNGQSDQVLQLIDPEQMRQLDSVKMKASWLGLCFRIDGKSLYVSGGNTNYIVMFDVSLQKLTPKDTFRLGNEWPELISPAGICLDESRNCLYVVTKESNALYFIDLASKKVIAKYILGAEGYTCLLAPDKKSIYVSCWGCACVKVFDLEKRDWKQDIPTGDHPNDMCMTRKGNFLYVANANDNSVSVIDMHTSKVVETLNAALFPASPSGSTTNSVALSGDEQTLYVANADNNCLALFDVSKPGFSHSKGFIPTGWYPTCVRTFGKNIFVANGKGFTSLPNPLGPNPTRKGEEVVYQHGSQKITGKEQYIGGMFLGTLSKIPVPDPNLLGSYSFQVYRNTPFHKQNMVSAEGEAGNPIPRKLGETSPIKHVFYIIKENRTYDQVLGDIPAGNGDTSLVLFGQKYTPNQHSIVNEFVLYDNFYVDGEVSADGHNWSTGAYANDYLEKTWPTYYGDRGGAYDSEGHRESANNKNGFIWNTAQKAKVSYRTYGEFADNYKANIPVLKDHFCPYYTGWDMKTRDTIRYHQWQREFDSLVKINKVPQLNTMRFSNDHTEGLTKGRPTPFAHVADNDLAVGLFLEHLSQSPIWKESVVFIVEDDAQNGPDHVDAHRSTLYVAGGYVKRRFVDHSMYSTSSVLHTIEMILGMQPMSQYDAAAPTLWKSFDKQPHIAPFKALKENVKLDEMCSANNKWSKQSSKLDFRGEDRVPDVLLNEIIWAAIKGESVPLPAPRHSAFLQVTEKEED